MATIDERIVAMRFDNKQFQSGVSDTIGSINKLNSSLKLDGASKGLDNVDRAAKSLNFSALSSAVDSISNRFSTLGIIAITALQNIANRAVDTGLSIVKSLTLEPIMSGFREYETQINAVQTILANTANKGSTIKDVNAALDELNTYADKTIYNFTEMTRNIGTFTAAGIDLKTSASAIKGIANLAAMSGSSSQQASTAMYQLSQAMASGTVKLMDWNSVVNAGMGGEVFQKALMDTARAGGVAIDALVKKEGSFRDSLDKGWLTTKVLTQTLAKFTGDLTAEQIKSMGYTDKQVDEILKLGKLANDAATKVKTFTQLMDTLKEASQSGWASSWRIISGDFEEAKELYTGVSNTLGKIIEDSAEARNKVLQGWKDLGGRKQLIDALTNGFQALISITKPIAQAFRDVFPPVTAQRLYELTATLKKFSEGLKIGADDSEKLRRAFRGLFAVADIVGQAIASLLKTLFGLGKGAGSAGDGLLSVSAKVGDFLVAVDKAVRQGQLFQKVFGALGFVISSSTRIFGAFIKLLVEVIEKLVAINSAGIKKFVDGLEKDLATLGNVAKNTNKFVDIIVKAFTLVGPVIDKAFSGIHKIVSGAAKALSSAFSGFSFKDLFLGINVGLLATITLSLKKFIDTLTGATRDGKGILASFKAIISGVTDSLSAMQANLKANSLMKIAISVGVLTASIIALSMIDGAKLAQSLSAVGVMLAELFGSMGSFELLVGSKNFASVLKVTSSMILLATAVRILASAVKELSDLSWNELVKGLSSIAALLSALTVAINLMPTGKKLAVSSTSLIAIGLAIKILASAVKDIGSINVKDLTKGLIGVGVLLTELSLFFTLTKFSGASISTALGIIGVSSALKILASAVEDFSKISVGNISKGLVAIGVLLAELAAFSALSGGTKGILKTSIGMTIISGALLILANALGKFGGMSWGNIAKGLVALGGSLAILAGSMYLMTGALPGAASLVIASASLLMVAEAMKKLGDMSWGSIGKSLTILTGALLLLAGAMYVMEAGLPGAAALIVMSGALAILAPVLEQLGNMSLTEIGLSLIALAGAFAVIGAAGYLLMPVVPAILGLAAAISLLGLGLLGIGAGILAFSVAMTALTAVGMAGVALMTASIKEILGLIPYALEQFGLGIIKFAEVISTGGPAMVAALTTVIGSLLEAIIILSPKFYEAFIKILDLILRAINEKTGPILDTLWNLIIKLVEKILVAVPYFVNAAFRLMIGFLQGVAQNLGGVISAAVTVIVAFLDGIGNNIGRVIDAGFRLIISFVNGLANGIRNNSAAMRSAGMNLASAIIDGMSGGLWSGTNEVVNSARRVASRALDAAKRLLGINSPSKEFFKVGKYSDEGLEQGLLTYSKLPEKAAEGVAKNTLTAFNEMANAIELSSTDSVSEPKITPIVDMTNIKEASKEIDKLSRSISYIPEASRISSGVEQARQATDKKTEVKHVDVKFEQTINSPKELSHFEIYRQTNNQLKQIKEVIDTA